MEIQIFRHPVFGEVRSMEMPNGQIGFVANDVAKALGYSNPRKPVRDHVCREDKTTVTIRDGGSNYQTKAVVINESGLYSLILSSQLTKAKAFKHWVTAEVLPQIRRTGMYSMAMDDEEVRALKWENRQFQRQIEEQSPKVAFADALSGSVGSVSISEMAKILTENGCDIGRTRFYTWLRQHGYIFKDSREPKQAWVAKGILEVKAVLAELYGGRLRENITPMVTPKGQRYFIERLCGQ